MDSTRDPSDWRRGSLECAFECITPTKPPRHLKSTSLTSNSNSFLTQFNTTLTQL